MSRAVAGGARAAPPPELQQWRRDLLRHAGFDGTLARRIAADSGYDVHAVIELVERGCPPALAARILAPLDEGCGAA